jgi:hypothetical protein
MSDWRASTGRTRPAALFGEIGRILSGLDFARPIRKAGGIWPNLPRQISILLSL